MPTQLRTVDELIGRIARRAHGVVTRAELLAAGVTVEQIAERVRRRLLIPVYRGVYRVGHMAPSVEADYMAAVKAAGRDALLSGLAAAHLWRLTKGEPPPPAITASRERRIPGIVTHHCRQLSHVDRTRWRGIPITTVPRTIVDIAARLDEEELARVCHEALAKYGATPRRIEAVLDRKPNAPGARKLRRVIHGDVHVTLSRLESRFLDRLREEGLPLPITNRPAGARYVDCRWPEHRLTAELDSYRFHNSRHSWKRDRQREREAYARGDDFRRYTWDDVFEEPRQMLTELRKLLSAGGQS
jgi:Transcriptional regulator, AbiEi antitoxin